jgi:hypothetical protein
METLIIILAAVAAYAAFAVLVIAVVAGGAFIERARRAQDQYEGMIRDDEPQAR